MPADFLHTTLGAARRPVFRLGLDPSYIPGEAALRSGIAAGMNYLATLWQAKAEGKIRAMRRFGDGVHGRSR